MTAKKDSDMTSYIARDVTPLERRFALSPTGARDLKRGILYSTLLNLTFILPSVWMAALSDLSLSLHPSDCSDLLPAVL